MDNRGVSREGGCASFIALAISVGLLLSLLLLAGCKTRYVPIEKTHTEWRDRIVTVTDTIKEHSIEVRHDSIFEKITVTLNDNGDTTRTDRFLSILTDNALKTENERLLRYADSLNKTQHDAIPIIREVEKPLSKWQQFKIDIGEISLVLLIIISALYIIRLRK